MPLTDFLSPAEIEAKFRKRYGVRAELALWAAMGLALLAAVAYFWGLGGPRGPHAFAAGDDAAAKLARLHQERPPLAWQAGFVDLGRPLLAPAPGEFVAFRWWRLARFDPGARADALRQGITTAVAVGDPLEWSATLAGAIADRRLAGPRVLPAVVLCHPARLRSWADGAARAVDGPDQAARVVRDAAAQGAAVVVLDLLAPERPRSPTLAAAGATARGLGRRVVGLAADAASLAEAVEAGAHAVVGSPVDPLPEWLMARLVARRAVFAPAIAAAPDTARPYVAANAFRARAAGVALGLATFGKPIAREVAALLGTGLPASVLADLPRNGAAALGIPPRDDFAGLTARNAVAAVVFDGYWLP